MDFRRSLILASGVLLGFSAQELNAETWWVPDRVPTIQQAVDTAVAGDIIQIAPGFYKESVAIQDRDGLRIVGSGADSTVVQPTGLAAFTVSNSSSISFEHLAIADGDVGMDLLLAKSIGISEMKFENLTWAVNSAYSEGNTIATSSFVACSFGLYSLLDTLTDESYDATFDINYNSFDYCWTGVYIDSSDHAILRNNVFVASENIAVGMNIWDSHDMFENLISGAPVGLFLIEYDDEYYPPDFNQNLRIWPNVTHELKQRAVSGALVRVYNNIFYQTDVAGVYGWYGPYSQIPIELRNNIFYQNQGTAVYADTTDADGSSWNDRTGIAYNTFFANAADVGGAIESPLRSAKNLYRDPLFVDAEHGDFSLQSRSTAIDSGTLDIDGDGVNDLSTYVGRSRDRGVAERSR